MCYIMSGGTGSGIQTAMLDKSNEGPGDETGQIKQRQRNDQGERETPRKGLKPTCGSQFDALELVNWVFRSARRHLQLYRRHIVFLIKKRTHLHT